MEKKSTRFFILVAMLSPHFQRLKTPYIFPIIEEKLAALQHEQTGRKILNLGVGDVALPLCPSIAEAICRATWEMTRSPRGYGPCSGYPFLKEAICEHEYGSFGIAPEEVFISDGTSSDASLIHEIFDKESSVLVTDPSYPIYRDASLLAGKQVHSLSLLAEEGFIPKPPKKRADLVYLCTPSNPTGVAMNRAHLSAWIAWAKEHRSLLIIDNVYHAFAQSGELPPSIYALDGGREVAIEMRSFSKCAGFTGLRCAYMIVPKTLDIPHVHEHFTKQVDIRTNGVAYPIQMGAKATFKPQVKRELAEQIAIYQNAAKGIRSALDGAKQTYFGGVDAPYIFWKTPEKTSSWEFFDTLLNKTHILSIPGQGFGPSGEGFVRLSSFLTPQLAKEAVHALHNHFTAG